MIENSKNANCPHCQHVFYPKDGAFDGLIEVFNLENNQSHQDFITCPKCEKEFEVEVSIEISLYVNFLKVLPLID